MKYPVRHLKHELLSAYKTFEGEFAIWIAEEGDKELLLTGPGSESGIAKRLKIRLRVRIQAEVLALKNESRILGQWSNPVSGAKKSQEQVRASLEQVTLDPWPES